MSKVGAIVIACLLILYGGTAYVAPLAAASSPKPTATAPQQLVHAFPLGPQRLCCKEGSRVQPTAGSSTGRSRSVERPGGATPHPGSSSLIWILIVGVGLLLLLAAAEAIHRTRRRAPVVAPSAGNGRAGGYAESARAASTAADGRSEGARAGYLMPSERPSVDGVELAYRRADEAGEPAGAFNVGVLLQQRRDLEGARAAYERAEHRGDPDAAFNLGVLLYDAGDLDGAEAAWRRSVHHGHPQAAANLRFLLQRRGVPEGYPDTSATQWRRTYRQPLERAATGPEATSDHTAAAASAGTSDSTVRTP